MSSSGGPAENDETATETTSRPASKSESDGTGRAGRVRGGSQQAGTAPRSAPYVPGARSSLYADVAGILDGTIPEPPAPTILATEGNYSLFYEGQVNLIFRDPECGKTWLALCAAAEALQDERSVLVLDLDHNGVESTVSRLLKMGVPVDVLRDPGKFRYAEPEDDEHLRNIITDVQSGDAPHVAIVDSVGELMPLLGYNSSSPDDFTLAHARVLKPLAVAGAAVLAIDHLPKGADSRGAGPTGTAAKRRAVGGVSLRVTVKDQFIPDRGGCASLGVNKDRHGGLRRHVLTEGQEPSAGVFHLDSSGDTITWRITAPKSGEALSTFSGTITSDVAELSALDPPPKSQRDVQERLKWGGSRAAEALRAYRSGSAPGALGADRAPSAPRSADKGVGARSSPPEQAPRKHPRITRPKSLGKSTPDPKEKKQ